MNQILKNVAELRELFEGEIRGRVMPCLCQRKNQKKDEFAPAEEETEVGLDCGKPTILRRRSYKKGKRRPIMPRMILNKNELQHSVRERLHNNTKSI